MARLTGPDESTRQVVRTQGVANTPFTSAAGSSVAIYAAAGGPGLADIQDLNGNPISGSSLTLDLNSLMPDFLFPDGITTVWAQPAGSSTRFRVNAREDDRLNAKLDASVASATYGVLAHDAIRGPLLAAKVLGGNIVVKPSGLVWAGLWAEWDWANWIKPQVDRASALGMSSVRIIGAPECVLTDPSGSLPKISQSTYNSRWAQLAAYCQYLGMTLYPALCEKNAYETPQGGGAGPFNFQAAATTAVITSCAATLSAFSNVIGFDLFQEGSGQADGLLIADVLALYAAVRAVAPQVPLTTSNSSGGFGSTLTFLNDATSLPYQAWTAAGGADFIDLHLYLDGLLPGDIDGFIARTNKPVIIGEFGDSQDVATATQTARFQAIAAIHNRPGIIASYVWALADQDTISSNKWGVFDNTGFTQPAFPSSTGSTPLSTTAGKRTHLTSVLPAFVKAEVPGVFIPPNLVPPAIARPVNTTVGFVTGANSYLFTDPRGLGFSATAAGLASVATAIGVTAVLPATPYNASVTLPATPTPRPLSFEIDFYKADKVTFISSTVVDFGAESTTHPVTLAVSIPASPALAAFAVHVVKVLQPIPANEARVISELALNVGSAISKPSNATPVPGLGFPATEDPGMIKAGDSMALLSGNTLFLRCREGGTLSKIGVRAVISSGNISLAVYANSGVGRAAVPGAQLATTGAIACPAATGYVEVALGSTLTMQPGDWLAISADNNTATFTSIGATGSDNSFGLGRQFRQAVHPAPVTPSGLVATFGYTILLIGAP